MKNIKFKVFLTLFCIWVIVTSASVLQVININDYINSAIKWIWVFSQGLFIWGVTQYSNFKKFKDLQVEKNKNYDDAVKSIKELNSVTARLEGIVSQLKK